MSFDYTIVRKELEFELVLRGCFTTVDQVTMSVILQTTENAS